MSGPVGPVALHGGGEFQPGDEAFLGALLQRPSTGAWSADPRRRRADRGRARRPDLAAAHGVNAFGGWQRPAAGPSMPSACRSWTCRAPPTRASPGGSPRRCHPFPGRRPRHHPEPDAREAAWAAITEAHVAARSSPGRARGDGVRVVDMDARWRLRGSRSFGASSSCPTPALPRGQTTVARFAAWAPPGLGRSGSPSRPASSSSHRYPATRRSRGSWSGRARRAGSPIRTAARRSSRRSGEVIETPVIPL